MGMSPRLLRLQANTQAQMDKAGEPYDIITFRFGTPFKEATMQKYRLDGNYLQIFQRHVTLASGEQLFGLVGERREAKSPRMLRKDRLDRLQQSDGEVEKAQVNTILKGVEEIENA